MGKSPSALPVRKVSIGAIAGAIMTIAVWLIRTYTHVDVPADVASAMTVLLTFVASYLTPPELQEGGVAGAVGSATSAAPARL